MKRMIGLLSGLFVVLGSLVPLAAQEPAQSGAMHTPPKVLLIIREFLKPGKAGMTHEKSESAFVQAFTRANWPTHYLAVDSMSGKTRALFLVGYDSFAAWEKDNRATEKNAALSAALDRASIADGNLLDSADQGVFAYNDEYSLRASVDIPHMRYFEITVFRVRPGHHQEWDDIVKMAKAAYEKAIPDAHWATYEAVYGAPGGTYLVFTPLKSLAETDKMMGEDKKFMAAMGKEGMKELEEMSAAAIESSETQLFAFNPRMSYVSPEWVKADPEFWKSKSMMAAAPKKAAKKPAPKE
jgi:hypothetical protein